MGDVYPRLRLAAVQAAPVWLNREATLEKATDLIREAGAQGANLVGFPESFLPGHPVWFYYYPATSQKSQDFGVELFKNSVEVPGPTTDALCQAAADAGTAVVMGLTERRPNTTGTLFNTQLFIDRRGQIIGKHQKLVPTVGERLVHTGGGGDTQRAVETEWGPISGLCCAENSNPLAVAVLASEYTRIHVACWPNHFIPAWSGMVETSLLASRNIAYTCKCFVISACGTNSPEMVEALAATQQDRAFLLDPANSGGSAIVDPFGHVIAGPLPGDQEGIVYADVDLDLTVRGHMVHDFGGHYNRSDVFQLLVNNARPPLVAHGPLVEMRESGAAATEPLTDGRSAVLRQVAPPALDAPAARDG